MFATVEGQWQAGVARTCGNKKDNKCITSTTGITLPLLTITNATGTYCYCEGDLCNSARIRETADPAAGKAPDGRIVLSFTASLSLLALAAGRFLSG